MPQIIIHSSIISDSEKKEKLLKDLREVISKTLNIPSKIGQVIIYESILENRSSSPDRNQNFIFVEVTMYTGRSIELKYKLAESIIDLLKLSTGVSAEDINIVIHEINKENYIGGISHKI